MSSCSVWVKAKKQKKVVFMLIIIFVLYLSIYYLYPARPGVNFFIDRVEPDHPGWKNWYDQGQYYMMSESIAQGNFDSSKFVYGIGYPITGVPFSLDSNEDSILANHPFFIPNFLMFFAVVYMTYSLSYRLTKNNIIGIFSVAFLLVMTLYLFWFIEPWNLHVVDVGIIGIFYLFFRNPKESSRTSLIIAGLLAGWIFSTRYLDIFWIMPLFVTFLIFHPKKVVYFTPGIMLILIVLLLHLNYFGDAFELPHIYRKIYPGYDDPVLQGVNFNHYDLDLKIISKRIYCILLDPMHCIPPKTGLEWLDKQLLYSLHNKTPFLASSSAFLIISPLGIALLLKRFNGQQRWILVSLMVGFIIAMISYNASAHYAAGWTRFFRYEMFWLPLFTIFSVYGMGALYYKIKEKL